MSIIEDDQFQIINIYSNNKDSGTQSNFYISLNINQGRQYDYMCVGQLAIPCSYYAVQSGFNTFTFMEDATSTTITVPVGNYNVNQLMNKLDALLEAASVSTAQFSITYPNGNSAVDTGKITYTITSGSATTYQFIFPSTTGINVLMGFDVSSTNTFSLGVLTSTNVINMKTNKMIYLTCDQTHDSCGVILQEIPNQGWGNMSIVTFQTTSIEMWSKKIISWPVKQFHFTLRDEANQEIDLNGQTWAFSLLFYKRPNNNKKLLQALKPLQELVDYVKQAQQDKEGEIPFSIPTGETPTETNDNSNG